MAFIYALTDPRTMKIRYVGKATDLKKRAQQHTAEARNPRRRSHRCNWLRALAKDGTTPTMSVLEEVSEKVWQERECHWIARLRAQGCELVNATDGGEGLTNPTAETRAKIGEFQKGNRWCVGRKPSAETLRRMSEAARGKRHSKEARARMSKSRTGRKHKPESRDKIAAALRGKMKSAAHCENLRLSHLGQKVSAETRALLSSMRKGVPKSAEHRKRIAEAVRAALKRKRAEL